MEAIGLLPLDLDKERRRRQRLSHFRQLYALQRDGSYAPTTDMTADFVHVRKVPMASIGFPEHSSRRGSLAVTWSTAKAKFGYNWDE